MKALPEQSELNIGMVGHVDHGKTTLTKALTGVWTDTYSEEIKRGISIKLGYADTAFYTCTDENGELIYTTDPDKRCVKGVKLRRVVSFVDAPGHETLMATMLSGAAIMNGALLLVAANQTCPLPQTKEHLMALEIMGLKNIVIVQNKIDLVTDERARENYQEIKRFVKGTIAENAPIIPVSAHHDANIDLLIEAIEETIPTPKFDKSKSPRMYIARSFDVNRPGSDINKLVGGVIGGSLIQGVFNIGDEIEIMPGFQVTKGRKTIWEPIYTTVRTLVASGKMVDSVKPGGLIAIGTGLDPALTKADGLTGRVAGAPGTLPKNIDEISVDIHLLENVVGHTTEIKVENIRTNEALMISVGTATTVGIVKSARTDIADISLKNPIVAEKGQRISISRKITNRWRLIGYGIIR